MSEDFSPQDYLKKAESNLKFAEHMQDVTFKLLNEPKIMLSVLDNIFIGYANALAAIVVYEKECKNVDFVGRTFEEKLNQFIRIAEEHDISKSYVKSMREVKELLLIHKKSPIEFSRKGKLVICNDSYDMKTLTVKDMKQHISKAKLFIEEIRPVIVNGRKHT